MFDTNLTVSSKSIFLIHLGFSKNLHLQAVYHHHWMNNGAMWLFYRKKKKKSFLPVEKNKKYQYLDFTLLKNLIIPVLVPSTPSLISILIIQCSVIASDHLHQLIIIIIINHYPHTLHQQWLLHLELTDSDVLDVS